MCCRWLRIAHLIRRGLIHMGSMGLSGLTTGLQRTLAPTDTGHVQHRHLTTNFKTAGNAADISIAAQVSKSFTTDASNEPLVADVGSARPSHDGNEKSVTYCRSERIAAHVWCRAVREERQRTRSLLLDVRRTRLPVMDVAGPICVRRFYSSTVYSNPNQFKEG